MHFKSGFVAIVGRPNVGKSSLLNNLIGTKVSIVTNKAQTTRNNIRGILTEKDQYQMVFIDTPGVHNSKSELDRFMNSSAFKSLKEVDVILFLVPADEKIGKNDLLLFKEIQKKVSPKFLVLTKSDLVSKTEMMAKLQEWNNLANDQFTEILPISNFDKMNLETLKNLILNYLPENEFQFYDENTLTDQSNRFLIREIIRENILIKTGQEIPHSVAILIDVLEEKSDLIQIEATIVVERNSQKGIIIGKQGKKIQDIKYKSKKQISTSLKKPVELDLFVKVKEKWRRSASLVKKMGYDKNKY